MSQVTVWGCCVADAALWPGDDPPEIWGRLLQVFAEVPGWTVSDDGAVWGIACGAPAQPMCGTAHPVEGVTRAQTWWARFAEEAIPWGVVFGHPRLWTVEVDLGHDGGGSAVTLPAPPYTKALSKSAGGDNAA